MAKDINTISKEELMQQVEGIEESRAEDIVNFCKERGGIQDLNELQEAPGISDQLINKLRESDITAGGGGREAREEGGGREER